MNIQTDDICLDLSIMSATADSWRKRKDVQSIEKVDCMQDGGRAILADLCKTTDAQVRGLRGCLLCVDLRMWVCVYYSAHSCAPPQGAQWG